MDMEKYTVKQIAQALDTSEETVRRWIRAGKLKASVSSKEKVISKEDLEDFLNQSPRYKGKLGGEVHHGMIGATLGSIAGACGLLGSPISGLPVGLALGKMVGEIVGSTNEISDDIPVDNIDNKIQKIEDTENENTEMEKENVSRKYEIINRVLDEMSKIESSDKQTETDKAKLDILKQMIDSLKD